MEQMMKQMGIDVEEIDATEVVIKQAEGPDLVFDDPDVTRMDARGQQTYQVIGDPSERDSVDADADAGTEDASEEAESDIPQSDVDLVAERTGASEADAREALEATGGDLAAAIDHLE